MKKIYLLLVLSFFIFSGCVVSPKYNLNYSLIKPTPSDTLEYADEFIDVVFSISTREIGFSLINKLNRPMKINWDDISIVYPDGKSTRIIHNGVALRDTANPQAPSTIPPNSKLEDFLVPAENIHYYQNDWAISPLIKSVDVMEWNDQVLRLYFPIDIKEESLEYNFQFKIQVSSQNSE